MVVGRQFPGNIVIGRALVLRIVLRQQQIHGVVAIGLVEAHHIRPGREAAFLEHQGFGGTLHFDMLAEQARHQLRDPQPVALVVGNQDRERRFLHALAPGVDALEVEIRQQRLALSGHGVERRERPGLVVVHVVAR